jgi:hypothetical protein
MGDESTDRAKVIFIFILCAFWLIGKLYNSSITSSIKELTIEADASARPTAPLSPHSHVVPVPAPRSTSHRARLSSHSGRQIAPDLPPPDSDQWQVAELPPPPPSLANHRTGKQKKK